MDYFNKTLIEGFSLRNPEVVELSQGEKVLALTLDSRRLNRQSLAKDFWAAQFSVVFPGLVGEELVQLLRQKYLVKVFGSLDQEPRAKSQFEQPWSFIVADRVVLRPFATSPDYEEYQFTNEVWERINS